MKSLTESEKSSETGKVKCIICGNAFEVIHWLHLRTHDISQEEYIKQFPDASLISADFRNKMSKITSGEKNGMRGRHHTEEAKNIIREANLGDKNPAKQPGVAKKISVAVSGVKHPLYGKTKENSKACKCISDRKIASWKNPTKAMMEGIEKMRESQKMKWQDDEFRKDHTGKNHGNYKNGKSFEPYCYLFNSKFKERVRERFNRVCTKCGKTEEEQMNEMQAKEMVPFRLSIHHVSYNKDTCCDDKTPLFVPLCIGCNTAVNYNRLYWQQYFTELINEQYDGKCFCTKEEMETKVLKNKGFK